MDKIIVALILLIIVFFIMYVRLRKIKRKIEGSAFFAPEDKKYFFQLINDYFSKKNIGVTIDDGIIYLEGSSAKLGLGNISQVCHQSPKENWPHLIAEHFDKIIEMMLGEAEFDKMIKDYAKASQYLGVRLYPKEYLTSADSETKNSMVYRDDIEDTITALVYDLPSSVRTVRMHDVQSWGKDITYLFGVALENVKKNCAPEIKQMNLAKNINVMLLSGENMFIATHVFFIKEYPGCVGKYGALIGLPHRHALISYPVEDLSVIDAVKLMISAVSGMFKEGPGSITSHLFWYDNAKLINLPYTENGKIIKFFPPDEFADLLNRLRSDHGYPFIE